MAMINVVGSIVALGIFSFFLSHISKWLAKNFIERLNEEINSLDNSDSSKGEQQ